MLTNLFIFGNQIEPVEDKTGPIKIVGSLESFIVRLEDEYNKSLQQINPHTQVSVSDVEGYFIRLAVLKAFLIKKKEMIEVTFKYHTHVITAQYHLCFCLASMIKQSSLY